MVMGLQPERAFLKSLQGRLVNVPGTWTMFSVAGVHPVTLTFNCLFMGLGMNYIVKRFANSFIYSFIQ